MLITQLKADGYGYEDIELFCKFCFKKY